ERLVAVRTSAEAEEANLKANYRTRIEEQLRIATLLEARKRGMAKLDVAIADQDKQAAELAERATSLNQLIDSPTARIEPVSGDAAASSAQGAAPAATLSDEKIRLALADTSRTAPAIPFPEARG